jgi:hypothetical protein
LEKFASATLLAERPLVGADDLAVEEQIGAVEVPPVQLMAASSSAKPSTKFI